MSEPENTSTGRLVKIILVIQILTLILIAYGYVRNSNPGGQHQGEIARYRENEAEYEKQLAEHKAAMDKYQSDREANEAEYERQLAEHKAAMDKYQSDQEAWKKAMSEYTSSVPPSPEE